MDKATWQARMREHLRQSTPNRANYNEAGINNTNAVGAFPGGASPYGVEEMAGNVWEWCSTQWLENYADYGSKVDDTPTADKVRVVRGGAFGDDEYLVRCAARDRLSPLGEVYAFGVRVVLSPFPLASGLRSSRRKVPLSVLSGLAPLCGAKRGVWGAVPPPAARKIFARPVEFRFRVRRECATLAGSYWPREKGPGQCHARSAITTTRLEINFRLKA